MLSPELPISSRDTVVQYHPSETFASPACSLFSYPPPSLNDSVFLSFSDFEKEAEWQ